MRTQQVVFAIAVAIGTIAGISACSDDNGGGPSTPGTALVALASSATDDGAISLTITGSGISRVQAANSAQQVFWRLTSATEVRVIVVGSLSAGPLLVLDVADASMVPSFRVAPLEVSRSDGSLREGVAGYTLTVARSQ